MATAITTTPQNITGDFDMAVRGNADDPRKSAILQKSLGATSTDWVTCQVLGGQGHMFVKNTGTNSYRLLEAVPGLIVEWSQ